MTNFKFDINIICLVINLIFLLYGSTLINCFDEIRKFLIIRTLIRILNCFEFKLTMDRSNFFTNIFLISLSVCFDIILIYVSYLIFMNDQQILNDINCLKTMPFYVMILPNLFIDIYHIMIVIMNLVSIIVAGSFILLF